VIDDSGDPNAAVRGRGKVRKDRGVFDRDLFLVVVAIRDPGLYLRARKRPGNEALVERMLIVVSFRADRVQPLEEARFSRRSQGEALSNMR
jgi:hypothetical protein